RRVLFRSLLAGVRHVDLAARYGGEEFAVVLPESALSDGVRVADRLRGALERAQIELSGGTTLRVTASFGVAVKGDLPRPEELISAADEALYEAKRAGKNLVAPVLAPEPKPEPQPEDNLERRRRKKTPPAAAKSPAKATPKKPAKATAKKRAAPRPRPAQGELS